MEDYQERVIDERTQLRVKHKQLLRFISTDLFLSLPMNKRILLTNQYLVMGEYLNILGSRISLF